MSGWHGGPAPHGGPEPTALGVYVHLPFCGRRCFYCDFATVPVGLAPGPRAREAMARYVRALEAEIESWAGDPALEGTAVRSIYFGGGTPTELEPDTLARILDACRGAFGPPEGGRDAMETTCEANPSRAEAEAFAALRAAGFNRLSLGAQAFQDRLLEAMGRWHRAADIPRAVAAARAAGLENVGLDLIYGLPGQKPADWEDTLDRCLDLAPEHVSAYNLIVEDGTAYGVLQRQGRLALPGEDTDLAMFHRALDRLEAAGYEHYELSNFARPGCRSRHNLSYWEGGWYVGLGLGAHSHLDGRRFWNTRRFDEYCHRALEPVAPGRPPGRRPGRPRPWVSGQEVLDERTRMVEAVMLGLRLRSGVDLRAFGARFGRQLDDVFPGIADGLVRDGLCERTAGALRLTRWGLFLAGEAMARFLN